MRVLADSKYVLKDLHAQIDLFDRKIAYCQGTEAYATAAERASALQKMMVRRDSLVKTALAMAGRGVESDPKHLPRSFREADAAERVRS